MRQLEQFGNMNIDWNLSPEHAVTMYLEWGNNNWHAEYPPVRSKEDSSTYFVVDTWGDQPIVRLVHRNSDGADDLISLPLPERLANAWLEEFGELKGISEPTPEVKRWLQHELGYDM